MEIGGGEGIKKEEACRRPNRCTWDYRGSVPDKSERRSTAKGLGVFETGGR